ncbi:MAG: chemotaxis protein CheC [bacterium]|nr:chemotaxis protein CheC [bacterium]MDD5354519.1 chemotaxis protein CheC [bacterium]MDD5756444.1 chemotaxis protein CheC [bacterium]
MVDKELPKLSLKQLDALKEISSIGAGNAATAFSQMLNRSVMMTVPSIHIVSINDVPQYMGGPETLVAGVYTRLLGDVFGSVLLTFPRESAFALTDILMGKKIGTTKILTGMGRSLLKETGMIVTGSFLTALSKMVNTTIIPRVPTLTLDMVGAIIDFILIDLSQEVEFAIVIEIRFEEKDSHVSGHFFLLPNPDSLKIILKVIGVEND